MTFDRRMGTRWIGIAALLCALALSFVLPQAAHAAGDTTIAFQGTVTDKGTGLPLKGAGVTVMGPDGYWTWGYTAADGTYAMFAPAAGDYDMHVDFYSGRYESAELTAVTFDGITATTQDVELKCFPLAFQGTVTDKVSGQPLEGVSVHLSGDLPSDYWFRAITAADGTYAVFAPADTYDVDVDGGHKYGRVELMDIAFNGTSTITKNVALQPYPVAFRGTVTDKLSGLPIEGAWVQVSGPDYFESVDTASDGSYEFYAPAGTYDIAASAPGNYKDVELTAVVFSGTSFVTRNLAMEKYPLAFQGTVTDKTSGVPIESAWVEVSGPDYWDFVSTASDGSYRAYVPAGTYDVTVSSSERYKDTVLENVAFGGATAITRNIALEPYPVAFRGTVTDATSGQPIEDAQLTVTDSNGGDHTTFTAANGTYSAYGPAGTFDAQIMYFDGYMDSEAVQVVFNGTTTLTRNFTLERYPLAFRGTVTDRLTGQPVEGIMVGVYSDPESSDYHSNHTFTADDGTYECFVPAGVYTVFANREYASSPYQGRHFTDVVFDGMSTADRDFELERYPLVAYGTVTDALTGQPIEGISINGWGPGDSKEDTFARTAADGTYSVYGTCGSWSFWLGFEDYVAEILFDGTSVEQNFVVMPVSEPPVAVADSYMTLQDTTLTVAAPGVLDNDTDADSPTLTAVKVTGPSHGTLTLESNGSFTYTPATGYTGTDGFTYRANDGGSNSGVVSVTITITPAPPAPYARFSGTDRFGTAIKASQSVFATGTCDAVVIATGMNYPDALSGAGLAGAANAPILLVSGDVLRADVKAEIRRVTQGKATYKVYILGSPAAVTTKMEASIKASLTGESVERFSGANRYATAQLVAAKVKSVQGASFGNTAILVTGLDYVDGLLVGPAAFAAKAPILLVGTTADTSLKNTLKSLGTTDLVVLGTTARIPVAVETSLKSGVPGLTTRRASNLTDTYARSAAAAEFFANPANGFGLSWAGVGIVTAEKFPDGLGAGCVEGKLGTSLLLTKSTSLPSTISAKITAHKTEIESVRFYGSVSAVSGSVETSVRNLLK